VIVVSALPVAYLASSGACQFDVVPAVAIACHMPTYAATALCPAASAGEDGDGDDGCRCADVLVGDVVVRADEFAVHPATATTQTATAHSQAAHGQHDGQ
jgi:hypothetical protein